MFSTPKTKFHPPPVDLATSQKQPIPNHAAWGHAALVGMQGGSSLMLCDRQTPGHANWGYVALVGKAARRRW